MKQQKKTRAYLVFLKDGRNVIAHLPKAYSELEVESKLKELYQNDYKSYTDNVRIKHWELMANTHEYRDKLQDRGLKFQSYLEKFNTLSEAMRFKKNLHNNRKVERVLMCQIEPVYQISSQYQLL